MSDSQNYQQILTDDQCLERLASKTFGRLVVRRKDDMDLFPINYVVNEGVIYFRTAEGTKLFSLSLNDDVLFEADNVDDGEGTAWSVIVKGTAKVLDATDALAAEDFGLQPWLPTLKHNFVAITPNSLSGREFALGEEPERY